MWSTDRVRIRRRRLILSSAGSVLALLLCLTACTIVRALREGRTPETPLRSEKEVRAATRWLLQSTLPYHEVTVPLIEKRDLLFVRANWAGRTVESMLDTGASAVAWPGALRIPGKFTGQTVPARWVNGQAENEPIAVVPRLRIGKWEMDAVPVAVFGRRAETPAKLRSGSAGFPPFPIIGAPALQGMVVTIDAKRGRLVLRAPAFDPAEAPTCQRRTVPISLAHGGLAVAQGEIQQRPVRVLIDTGANYTLIPRRFAALLPTVFPSGAIASHGATLVIFRQPLRLIVGAVPIEIHRAVITSEPLGSELCLSPRNMPGGEVTIDYCRRKLVFGE